MEVHPAKKMQDCHLVDGERKKLQQMSVTYGSHMAMRRVIEASLLAQVQRPSGHKSSMFGLNHHLNRYEELEASDIYNDPFERPDMDNEGQRFRLEK